MTSDDKPTVPKLLTDYMNRQGTNQSGVAYHFDVTRQTVHYWMTEESVPDARRLLQIKTTHPKEATRRLAGALLDLQVEKSHVD